MKYRSEIDGLRALAVVPVILFHAGFNAFSGGFVGVDVFFVISGYLITTILLNDLEAGKFSIVHFYERRARRILPALFLVMFACLPFAWFWLHMKSFSQSLVAVSVFASNILFWRTSGYFDTATELKPLIHTWSLSVEEQYYVLFPLFLFFAWRLGKRWTVGILAVVALVSLGLAQWGAYAKPAFTFYMLPTRAWELLIGAFVAFYYSEHNIKKHKYWASELGSLSGFALIAYATFAFSEKTPFPSLYALVPTVGAALIIVFATNKTLIGKLLSTKPFLWVGLISYSAYLWHQPLFAFARHRSLEEPSQALLSTLALITLPLAYLTWRFIERPFRNKHAISRKTVFVLSACVSAVFIAIGISGNLTKGFIFHYNPIIKNLYETKDDGILNGCEESLDKMGITCTLGKANISPTIAIVGDSHSTRLTSYLSPLLEKRNLSAQVYAQSWCPPMIDIGTDNPGKNPGCRNYRRNTFDEIISNPKISKVLMVAEWGNYTQGYRGEEKTITFYTDAISREQSLTENVEVVKRSLVRTIQALKENGKEVIIIKTVPEYKYAVPYLLQKNFQSNAVLDVPEHFKVDYLQYSQRNREIEAVFLDALVANNTTFIDTYSIYCPKEKCLTTTDQNESFYIDGNHLTKAGSKSLVEAIETVIK